MRLVFYWALLFQNEGIRYAGSVLAKALSVQRVALENKGDNIDT